MKIEGGLPQEAVTVAAPVERLVNRENDMSTLINVKNGIADIADAVTIKGREIVEEVRAALEVLEEYEGLFEDSDHAASVKDYYDEMVDIFDDTYEAGKAKELVTACEWENINDDADFRDMVDRLRAYEELGDLEDLAEIVSAAERAEETEALSARIEELEAELKRAKDAIAQGIAALGGVTVDNHRTHCEQEYERGLSDGMVLRVQVPEAVRIVEDTDGDPA